MTPRLNVLPGDRPDEIDLELLELGAVPSSDQRARIEAAREDLGPTIQELNDARAYFSAHAPPLRPRASRSGLWVAATLALAAVALFVVGLRGDVDDGLRSMGGLPVELQVLGPDGAWRSDPVVFHADDELLATITAPRDGYLDVWTRQADGTVSALVVGAPVAGGETLRLPGAIRLDPYSGEEWLLARITDEPSRTDDLHALDRTDLEPGRSFAVEVTRQP